MPLRRSEEYPLINADSGGDKPLDKPAVIPVEWNVSCTPTRPSWISRWPQFVSACWMSIVLLTIMFVIFYAFGSIYRLQSVIHKYESKPTGEVYYHYVLPRDNSVQFKTFTNYLSFMATEYPLLNFNVRVLIDNAPQSPIYKIPKKSLFSETFFPEYTGSVRYVFIKNNDRDIQELQRKHPNVKVSVLCLSKYTAKTPFQYNRWRSIPSIYLPFYVSAYEVWKNGGIGLNLLTENQRFHLMRRIDFKLDTLLKQHSKSVDLTKYTQALEKIDVIDEREFFALFFDAFNEIPRMMIQTINFGIASDNGNLRPVQMTSVKVKRSISSNEILENTPNDTKTNISYIKTHDTINKENESNDTTQINNTTDVNNNTVIIQNNSGIVKEHAYPNNEILLRNTPIQYNFHKYEISRLLDNIPAFVDIENTPDLYNKKNYQNNYLTLSSDGTVVAAYSRNHQFLSKMLFKPRPHLSPRYVISNTLHQSCFRSNRADYCDSIKILNNL
ncbi:uncharacterized protein LOC121732594 [Aricia agestis]|uniref:uncharacterized protein LOC121732594 n=1 Tax=Aricia agestis TaxID=91739 RepID=UPI001C205C6A|nr:uncharacterized protein LOC121732594 [Aricia agestis]XP_041978463.1 uncharacterized protein LOC121732594 [Aricia agestis]XP_041978464.1 uncharacterized protein LOC121732594 [Aricia agestis]